MSLFGESTLVHDEYGEDYVLRVVSDVNDDNMIIVLSVVSIATRAFTHVKTFMSVCHACN